MYMGIQNNERSAHEHIKMIRAVHMGTQHNQSSTHGFAEL